MDTFVEQIVVKRKSIKDFAIIFFSIIAAFIVAAIIFLVALPFLGMIAFLLAGGAMVFVAAYILKYRI